MKATDISYVLILLFTFESAKATIITLFIKKFYKQSKFIVKGLLFLYEKILLKSN